jgi:transposase-like protein
MRSRDVSLLLFLFFRVKVTHKTVCDWSKKFRGQLNLPIPNYSTKEHLITHVDEKYILVNGEWNYWWTLKDWMGNVLHWIVTKCRSAESARKLFKETRRKLNRDVDILVRDGLPAYDKTAKILGRKCKSIIAGIHGKPVIYKKNVYFLTNNPAESINAEIDSYLARFQYHFANLESAQRYADNFMLTRHLKRCFAEKKFSEASSLLTQAFNL